MRSYKAAELNRTRVRVHTICIEIDTSQFLILDLFLTGPYELVRNLILV